jgi:hypothetical protein
MTEMEQQVLKLLERIAAGVERQAWILEQHLPADDGDPTDPEGEPAPVQQIFPRAVG